MQIQTIGKQRGITLIGFLMLLALAGFFGFLIMRLLPVYTEYYGVVKDVKSACQEMNANTATLDQVREKLDKRFYISYVTNVNTKKDLKLVRDGDKKIVNINYEVRKPLIYNLDFVAKFDVTQPIGGAAGGE